MTKESERVDEEERKAVMERVKKMAFMSTNRVKDLQSKLLYRDVMEEREAQLEVKKKREELEKLREAEYVRQSVEEMKRYDEMEEKKKKTKKVEIAKLQKVLHTQMLEFKALEDARIAEGKKDGAELKARMQAYMEEDEIHKAKAREEIVRNKEEQKKWLEEQMRQLAEKSSKRKKSKLKSRNMLLQRRLSRSSENKRSRSVFTKPRPQDKRSLTLQLKILLTSQSPTKRELKNRSRRSKRKKRRLKKLKRSGRKSSSKNA
eukprot:TRINITY_DN1659_c1_g1_i6.p1 TRINITY_DN1659_c1_g1~~TRINITY_DN1659_c1_g1_i6.p1  ORF type:complete len:261 (-),score=91.16 TRINITY_DN1659_c1_g1_i6:593-1375(-)